MAFPIRKEGKTENWRNREEKPKGGEDLCEEVSEGRRRVPSKKGRKPPFWVELLRRCNVK